MTMLNTSGGLQMGVGPSNCRAPLVGGLVMQRPERWQCQYNEAVVSNFDLE